MEDEQAPVEQEQVSEIDILKLENGNLKHELQAGEGKIAALEKALADRNDEITAVKKSLADAAGEIVEQGITLKQAVVAYKELVGQANPGLVAEMITGDTIAEINVSLKNAQELVARVKREVVAEDARVRVPAGAPQRTLPDLTALTAREKIKYGIEGG